jgi:hypothetical protein
VDGATGYRVHFRPGDQGSWGSSHADVGPDQTSTVLQKIIVDDTFIGVSALGKGGAESLVTFGGLK